MDQFIVTIMHKTVASQGPRWAPEKRLEFIDFRLQWDRTINRSQLIDFFGISAQQASTDLAKYLEAAPGNLEYDRSAKTYRATPKFRPQRVDASSEGYLAQLAEVTIGRPLVGASLIGWRPPCEVLRLPVRTIEPDTLLQIQRAIRSGKDVNLRYQSMRLPEATTRWIAPHALANDGLRWHTRAWCYVSNTYRDFVLSRIQMVQGQRSRTVQLPADVEWETPIDIVIRARSELSRAHRIAIETEYGMVNGRLVIRSRKAMAFYLLRLMHVDGMGQSIPAIQQPLELEQNEELAAVIAAARKAPEAVPINDAQN